MHIQPAIPAVVTDHANTKQPPAQAARAALADQSESSDQQFGKMVSDFARGITPSATQPE